MGSLIFAIISLAAAGVQAGVSAHQTKKSRSEAKKLAARERKDIQRQELIDRRFQQKQLGLRDKQLDFDAKTARQQELDFKREEQDLEKKRRGNILQRAGAGLTNLSSPSMKARSIERFGI